MFRLIAASALAALVLSACETVEPAPPEPVVEAMSEAQFETALNGATTDPAPYSGERKLTSLVDNAGLTPNQRARALYARAGLRWKKTFDKVGAKADFDEYVRLYPTNRFANNARIESGYVQTELTAAQSRMQGLQTLRAWFDDAWAVGKRDEAAARQKRSGLTPDAHQVYQLRATGYLCEGSGTEKLHKYGPVTTEIQDLYWCK